MTEGRKLSSIFCQKNLQKGIFHPKNKSYKTIFICLFSSSIGILFMSADHQNELSSGLSTLHKKWAFTVTSTAYFREIHKA